MLLVAVAAVLGVLLDSTCYDGNSAVERSVWRHCWCIAALLCLATIVRASPAVRRIVAVLVFLPFAGFLHNHRADSYANRSIQNYLTATEQPTVIRGTIDQPVVLRTHGSRRTLGSRHRSPLQTQLEIQIAELRVGQRFQSCDGRVLIVVEGQCHDLLPGDAIEVYGKLCRFNSPSNPGERDLRPIYRRRDLQARVDVANPQQIVVMPETIQWKNRIHRWIARLAIRGRRELMQHTTDATGPLAVAMVLGQRDYIDNTTRDLLLVTGTAHLLSVSGLHLAIFVVLANFLATILRLPMRLRIICIIILCLFYTALTGGRPPVIRASILVGSFLMSVWLRRVSQPINTLSVAAFILILLNPDHIFSIGVQLSFLAVATLILCGQRSASHEPLDESERQDERLTELMDSGKTRIFLFARQLMNMLGKMLWFSACVTLVCLPLVWYQFHVVSPISLIVNVILGPCLFVALAAGLLVIATGMLHDSLAIVPGWICSVTLDWMQWVMTVAARIPHGHAWLPSPPGYWIVVFYILLAASFLFRPVRRWDAWFRYLWIGIWIPVAYLLATVGRGVPAETLEGTFLNVGHGTCVILRMPQNEVWLYDCGRLGNESYSSAGIDTALWSMGVTQLNGIILSHADSDHFNALPGILQRFQVDRVITPPGMLAESEPALIPIREAMQRFQIDVLEVNRDAIPVNFPQIFRVLHPPLKRLSGSDNANSLVLQIDWQGNSVILPGDLEPPGTAMLINMPRPKPGGVLMAPHHGSLRMEAASVLHWARPQKTVVSGGQRARKPEVREMLSAHGSAVHITAVAGAIRVRIGKHGDVDIQEWSCAGW
jgi:competence protein ComEC